MRFSALVTILLLLLLCLVTALDPCPSRAEANEADRLYSVGRERIAAGEYRQAEQAFAQAVVENPHHGEAMLQLASLYSRNILTYGKAEDILLSIPEAAGKTGGTGRDDLLFRAGVSMGKLYVKNGRSSQAVALLRNVVSAITAWCAAPKKSISPISCIP